MSAFTDVATKVLYSIKVLCCDMREMYDGPDGWIENLLQVSIVQSAFHFTVYDPFISFGVGCIIGY